MKLKSTTISSTVYGKEVLGVECYGQNPFLALMCDNNGNLYCIPTDSVDNKTQYTAFKYIKKTNKFSFANNITSDIYHKTCRMHAFECIDNRMCKIVEGVVDTTNVNIDLGNKYYRCLNRKGNFLYSLNDNDGSIVKIDIYTNAVTKITQVDLNIGGLGTVLLSTNESFYRLEGDHELYKINTENNSKTLIDNTFFKTNFKKANIDRISSDGIIFYIASSNYIYNPVTKQQTLIPFDSIIGDKIGYCRINGRDIGIVFVNHYDLESKKYYLFELNKTIYESV